MRDINMINTELEAANALLQALRLEREQALIAACPYKVGEEFKTAGNTYKVCRVNAAAHGNNVWLTCLYMTGAKKWSRGTKLVAHAIG